ncbi:MDR family MFS transporter [Clostridium arbusti]|uniref:MDR family MFS transporter n=1 Tax=Clostridium arbusti TaxID=1137848 RepID=UPI00028A1D6E|nr:MDR family MFS transporter [Clostridium arbusti]
MTFTNVNKKTTVLIMIGVMVSILLASLDGTIVTTAMPKIVSSLQGFDYYTWPMIAYLLCITISMPLFGKLADVYGFKPVYIFGIIVFLLGSALCGISQNMMQLIFFRGFQGMGGAILISNSLAIIGILFAPAERAKYVGIASSAGALASIVGPSLGGFITDNFSWRWVFYVNVPIAIIAFIIIILVLPPHRAEERKKIDYFGAISLIIALVPMLLAFTWAGKNYDWNSVQIIGMLVFSVLMLIVFAVIETKAEDPIIPMSLFKNFVFNISAIEMFLISGILMGGSIFIPLFAQEVIGSSASKSGAILTPMMLSLIVGAMISGLLVSKTNKYKLQAIIGFVILLIGSVMLLNLGVNTSNSQVIIAMIILGFGVGIGMPIFSVTAQSAFSESKIGVVTSSTQFFKSLGQTIASSVLGTIMSTAVVNDLKDLNTTGFPASISKVLKNPNALSGGGDSIKAIASKLPKEMLPHFMKLIDDIKQILSNSIHDVFIICLGMAILGLIISLFIKEIPLSKTKNSSEL